MSTGLFWHIYDMYACASSFGTELLKTMLLDITLEQDLLLPTVDTHVHRSSWRRSCPPCSTDFQADRAVWLASLLHWQEEGVTHPGGPGAGCRSWGDCQPQLSIRPASAHGQLDGSCPALLGMLGAKPALRALAAGQLLGEQLGRLDWHWQLQLPKGHSPVSLLPGLELTQQHRAALGFSIYLSSVDSC